METESKLSLEKITVNNFDSVISLHTFPRQKRFIPTNSYSLIQAQFHKGAWKRAICLDGKPIGFVMLYVAKAKTEKEIFLWRFMISRHYQKDGNGTKAFNLVLEHIRKTWPSVNLIKSCFVKGPGSPGKFWIKKGFKIQEQTEEDIRNGEIPIQMEIKKKPRHSTVKRKKHRPEHRVT
jgi:diamine N-acetyltransferase